LKNAALLIEDRDTQLVVRTALECSGFTCDVYLSTVPLLRALKRDVHGVIVADVDGTDADCSAMLAWRHNWLNPAVTLVAIGSGAARAAADALAAGVDDFVAKPVHGAELLARIAAAARRREQISVSTGLSVAGCCIDRASSALVSPHARVEITSREMGVAQLLFENAGRLVTRSRLAHDVWGMSVELTGRSIEQHIYQLRRKLKRCAGDALALRGVYGSGYRLDVSLATGTLLPAHPPAPASPFPWLSA